MGGGKGRRGEKEERGWKVEEVVVVVRSKLGGVVERKSGGEIEGGGEG